MNENITFPDRPGTSVVSLQRDVKQLVSQLGDGATALLYTEIALASGTNKIRHNLDAAPRSVSVTPYSSITWYMPTQPDATFVYVYASGAATADLQVWI